MINQMYHLNVQYSLFREYLCQSLKAGSSIIKLVHDGYDLIITKKVDNMPIIHRLAHYNLWVVLFRTVKRSKYYRYGVKYQLIKALIELIKSINQSINQSMKQSIKEASKQCIYHYVSRISFIYLRPSPDLWWSAMIARDVVSFFSNVKSFQYFLFI